MIDCRGNQVGNACVCLHAGPIRHWGRATRSVDHDAHGHRLRQNQAQTGFEGSGQVGEKHSRERRWVLLKIPRCDIDGVGEGK